MLHCTYWAVERLGGGGPAGFIDSRLLTTQVSMIMAYDLGGDGLVMGSYGWGVLYFAVIVRMIGE